MNFREDNLKLDSVRPDKSREIDAKYPEPAPKKPRIEPPKQTIKTRALLARTAFHRDKKIRIRITGTKVITKTFERPLTIAEKAEEIAEGIKTGVALPEVQNAGLIGRILPPPKPEKYIHIDRKIKPITTGIQPPPVKKILPRTTTKILPEERTARSKLILDRLGQKPMVETIAEGGNWLDRFFVWINKILGS